MKFDIVIIIIIIIIVWSPFTGSKYTPKVLCISVFMWFEVFFLTI